MIVGCYLCTLFREYDVDFADDDGDDDDVPSIEDAEVDLIRAEKERDLIRAEKERQLGNELFGKQDWLGAIAK